MENEINPKAGQDNANTKPDQNFSSRSIGEGAKPQKDNNQTTYKEQDDSKNKPQIPRRGVLKWLREPKLTDWIIAIATVSICVTSLLQWKAIRGQLWISQKFNEISVLTQRAFINFSTIKGNTLIDPNKRQIVGIQFLVVWENSGTTPTKSATGISNIQSWPSALPKGFEFGDRVRLEPIKTVIGPKGTVAQNVSQSLVTNIKDLIEVQKGNSHLFFWGSMVYHDIFDNTPPRLTEFCVEIINVRSTKTNPFDPENRFIWDVSACPEHNCYDENCPDYSKRTQK